MIYLDHAATTPLDPRVLEAMLPYLREPYGNASSLHWPGRRARQAVEDARETIAAFLGARPTEIVFTSGGSESDTYALRGVATARQGRGRHLLTTPIEHPAVLRTADRLAQEGYEVEYLPVDADGRVDPAAVAERLRDDTILVSVMHGNNEIGTVQPLAAIGAVCAERGVPLHTDAVQSLGQEPLDVRELQVSLLAASAHKIGGPQGVGLCYQRTGLRLPPLVTGGGQERGRRAGTEPVAAIVGFAAAVALVREHRDAAVAHLRALRDRLIDGVLERVPGAALNGPRAGRLANNASFSFERVHGENLLILLDGLDIAVSTGSACHSGATDPSHVLLATVGQDRALGSLRLTLGRTNTAAEIEQVLDVLPDCVARLRDLVPAA